MHGGGVGVAGAERRLAEVERAHEDGAGTRAVARVQEREAAQPAEVHPQPVKRLAHGECRGERVGAVERRRGCGVIAQRELGVGAQAEHVRCVEGWLALLGEKRVGGRAGERGRCGVVAGREGRGDAHGGLEGAALSIDAHR